MGYRFELVRFLLSESVFIELPYSGLLHVIMYKNIGWNIILEQSRHVYHQRSEQKNRDDLADIPVASDRLKYTKKKVQV